MKKQFRAFLAYLLAISLIAAFGFAAFADDAPSTVITREDDGELTITRRTRSATTPMGDEGWTILLYLCGSDLESDGGYATGDLEEILAANSSGKVRMIIQTGGANEWQNNVISSSKTERYIAENGQLRLLESLPKADMGDARTLTDFVSWGVKNYGAARMGLIFWNHGSGSINGVCFDETEDYNSLTLRDIDTALGSAYSQMSDRFEFIGFDACLMATLETANLLAPYSRYLYASEELEPGTGWDYTSILNALVKNPSMNGAELGKIAAQSYYDLCAQDGDCDDITFSVVNLDKLDALIVAFDRACQELYESGDLTAFARGAIKTDNFGGNSRREGYTNMIDLGGLLQGSTGLASSASDALGALDDAIVCSINGRRHNGAGGLSLYYPLSVQGSKELSVFRDVCPSTYYLALVDKLAYGVTGNDPSEYDNSSIITGNGTSFLDLVTGNSSTSSGSGSGSSFIGSITGNTGGSTGSGSSFIDMISNFGTSDYPSSLDEEDCPLAIEGIYLDEDGIYTVAFSNMDNFAYGSCTLYFEFYLDEDEEEWWDIYLGEDDDVYTDYDEMIVQDNFDGSWICLEDNLLPIELVAQYDTESIYTVAVVRNGEETNLQIRYDWEEGEFTVLGTWDGIDPETGMAARSTVPLEIGDTLEIIYDYIDEYGEWDYFLSDPFIYEGSLALEYQYLPEGDYDYCINLYDIYGNSWQTESVLFGVDEDGEVFYYE